MAYPFGSTSIWIVGIVLFIGHCTHGKVAGTDDLNQWLDDLASQGNTDPDVENPIIQANSRLSPSQQNVLPQDAGYIDAQRGRTEGINLGSTGYQSSQPLPPSPTTEYKPNQQLAPDSQPTLLQQGLPQNLLNRILIPTQHTQQQPLGSPNPEKYPAIPDHTVPQLVTTGKQTLSSQIVPTDVPLVRTDEQALSQQELDNPQLALQNFLHQQQLSDQYQPRLPDGYTSQQVAKNFPDQNLAEQFPDQRLAQPQFPDQRLAQPQFPDQQLPQPQFPDQQLAQPQFPDQRLVQPQFPDQRFEQPQFPDQQLAQQQFPDQQLAQQQYPDQQLAHQQYSDQQLEQQQYSDQQLAKPQFSDQQLAQPQFPDQQLAHQQYSDQQLEQQQYSDQQLAQPQFPDQQLAQPQFPDQQLAQPQFPDQQLAQPQFPDQQLEQPQFPDQQLAQPQFPDQQLAQPQFPDQQLAQPHFPDQQLAQQQFPDPQLAQQQYPDQQLAQQQFPNQNLVQQQFPDQQLAQSQFLDQQFAQQQFPDQQLAQQQYPDQQLAHQQYSDQQLEQQQYSDQQLAQQQYPDQQYIDPKIPQQIYDQQLPQGYSEEQVKLINEALARGRLPQQHYLDQQQQGNSIIQPLNLTGYLPGQNMEDLEKDTSTVTVNPTATRTMGTAIEEDNTQTEETTTEASTKTATHSEILNQHLLKKPEPQFLIGGVPQDIGGVPQDIGGVPQDIGGVPQDIGGVPQDIGGVPQDIGGVPQDIGGVPQDIGEMPHNIGVQGHLDHNADNLSLDSQILPAYLQTPQQPSQDTSSLLSSQQQSQSQLLQQSQTLPAQYTDGQLLGQRQPPLPVQAAVVQGPQVHTFIPEKLPVQTGTQLPTKFIYPPQTNINLGAPGQVQGGLPQDMTGPLDDTRLATKLPTLSGPTVDTVGSSTPTQTTDQDQETTVDTIDQTSTVATGTTGDLADQDMDGTLKKKKVPTATLR